MATVTIELDEETERLLRAVAADERRSAQDLFREALEQLLRERGRRPSRDRHEALRKMIGLVKRGPTDASVSHDLRAEDAP